MPEYTPTQIWYASETRALSALKFIVYEDKGRLKLEHDVLSFQGKYNDFQIKQIKEIQLARQMVNWPIHLIGCSVLAYFLIQRGFAPVPAVTITVLAMVLGISVGYSTKWVKVTYQTSQGRTTSAWFADGGGRGWSGIFGGTSRLYEVIRSATLETDAPSETAIVLGNPVASAVHRKPVPERCPYCDETVIPDEGRRCPACDRPI